MKNVLIGSLLLFRAAASADYLPDTTKQVVFDTRTGLIWQDSATVKTTQRNWQEAIDYCESLVFADRQDWRLPNRLELYLIADRSQFYPTIDTDAFQNIASSFYWTSTTNVTETTSAWAVNFEYGDDSWRDKSSEAYYVRCVRSGE